MANYKRYAQLHGYSWALDDAVAAWVFQQACVFCGVTDRNGMCRLDPTVYAYVNDNVLSACATCAFMKVMSRLHRVVIGAD